MSVHELLIAGFGKSFDPNTVKVMGEAFDRAWAEVADQFSACDAQAVERARSVVAEAIIAHATNASRDVDHLRHVGLGALVLQYPWLVEDHRKQA